MRPMMPAMLILLVLTLALPLCARQPQSPVTDCARQGLQAEAQYRIGDALMNYTWALALLQEQGTNVRDTIDAANVSLAEFLPGRINRVLSSLQFTCTLQDYSRQRHTDMLNLQALYNGVPVRDLEVRCLVDGQPTYPIGMLDGQCVIEYPCEAGNTPAMLVLDVSCAFADRARFYPGLYNALAALPPQLFKQSRFEVEVAGAKPPAAMQAFHSTVNEDETAGVLKSIRLVTDAILNDDYASVRALLTPDGAESFERIIHEGRPLLVGPADSLTIDRYDESIIVRGIKMQFAFKSNHRNFVENVVFSFRQDGLIDKIGFGLSESAVQDIFASVQAGDIEQRRIRAFLEDYKTAYCLKDIYYLEKVFSDEALIIVGKVLKSDSTNISDLYNHLGEENWRASTRAKQDFLTRLQKVFDSNEYVNLAFTDNSIERSKRQGEHLFGMQLHQYFYSQNYYDAGYLFLMFDLQNPNQPRIYVRTWQLDKSTDGSVFGLSDFD